MGERRQPLLLSANDGHEVRYPEIHGATEALQDFDGKAVPGQIALDGRFADPDGIGDVLVQQSARLEDAFQRFQQKVDLGTVAIETGHRPSLPAIMSIGSGGKNALLELSYDVRYAAYKMRSTRKRWS